MPEAVAEACPALQRLSIRDCSLQAARHPHSLLAQCAQLQHLSISGTHISSTYHSRHLAALAQLPCISSLELQWPQVAAEHLPEGLASKLTALSVLCSEADCWAHGMQECRTKLLRLVSQLTGLQRLHMEACCYHAHINNCVTSLTNLQALSLPWFTLGNSSTTTLASLPRLTQLHAGDVCIRSPGPFPAAACNLHRVSFEHAAVSDLLQFIAMCPTIDVHVGEVVVRI